MGDLKDRITVREMIYHQQAGEQPTGTETKFSHELESHEQPYQRRLSVGEDWIPLDHGWIEEASLLSIFNEEGKFLQVNPTDEERAEAAKKVLQVSPTINVVVNPWIILPGQSMRGCPLSIRSMFVRSQSGVISFSVHIFPR